MIVCGRPAQRAEQRLERSVAARMAAAFNRDQAVGFVCGFFVCATLVLVSQPSDVASLLPSRGHRKLVEEVQLHQVAPHHQRSGFYVMPETEHLCALNLQDEHSQSDKTSTHNYQTLYSKMFEMGPGRHRVHKLLEIGLGCGMMQGKAVGASARLWRRFFPAHTEIWVAEYDVACVKDRAEDLKPYNLHFVLGDQGKPEDNKRWVTETGGDFDIIIDDGGHFNIHQWQSFKELFVNALKPGGAYVIEDVNMSAWGPCDGNAVPDCQRPIDFLSEWLEMLMMGTCTRTFTDAAPERKRNPFHGMLPGIKTIECASEACVITKCFLEDKRCYYDGCMDTAYDAINPWKPK